MTIYANMEPTEEQKFIQNRKSYKKKKHTKTISKFDAEKKRPWGLFVCLFVCLFVVCLFVFVCNLFVCLF